MKAAWAWDVTGARQRFSWAGWYALSPGVFEDEVRDRFEEALEFSKKGVEEPACVSAIASVPHLSPAAYPMAVFLLKFVLSERSPGRPALVYLTDCCLSGQTYAGFGSHPAFREPVPAQMAIRAEVLRHLPELVDLARSWPDDMVEELVYLLYASYWDMASGSVAQASLATLASWGAVPELRDEPDEFRGMLDSGRVPNATDFDEPTRAADESYAIQPGRPSKRRFRVRWTR